jgi:hypothetical protein
MRRPKPDLRRKWSDPNLPCIRAYTMPDGSKPVEIDPDYERRYREYLMETSVQPKWNKDPTYDMRKDRK